MFPRRALLAAPFLAATQARAATSKIRIGQATPAVSFLPIAAARALGSFPAAGLDLDWAAIPGGDPACLAALDSGDIDLAAVGSETLLNAIAKGQPFQFVASVMSKVSLELVISAKRLQAAGLDPATAPLPARLAAVKDAVVGVSAIGGTQDRAARWLARQAGLDPRTGIQVAMAGPPPSIQAALEAGRIDAYVLSPPEGLISEANGTGRIVVRMGDEFPALRGIPFLVLAAKTPVSAERATLLRTTLAALQSATATLRADTPGTAARIHAALFPRIAAPIITTAITGLVSGLDQGLVLDAAGMKALLAYAADAAAGLDPARTDFWTNAYLPARAP